MDPSDIRYILALTRRDHSRIELAQIAEQLSAMTSRLSSLLYLTKTLETDLQIPASDSSNLRLLKAKESLCHGREDIETWLALSWQPRIPSAATTSGSSTTKSSPRPEPAKDST